MGGAGQRSRACEWARGGIADGAGCTNDSGHNAGEWMACDDGSELAIHSTRRAAPAACLGWAGNGQRAGDCGLRTYEVDERERAVMSGW